MITLYLEIIKVYRFNTYENYNINREGGKGIYTVYFKG